MRFFRCAVITVLLLACVVLGTACTGAKGEEGLKGDTGATGVGIQNIVNNGNGTFTVNLTDGTAYTTDNFTGPQGEQGTQGPKGDTGAIGSQGPQGIPGLVMESLSDNITVSNDSPRPLHFTYSNTRHLSITVGWSGLDGSDQIIISNLMGPYGFAMLRETAAEGSIGWDSCEFDAKEWMLDIYDTGGSPLSVHWRVTVTSPQ